MEKPLLPSRRLSEVLIVHLLREIENFLRAAKIPAARFGREVMGDPRFVFDLRNGREPRARTVARIRNYLEAVQ